MSRPLFQVDEDLRALEEQVETLLLPPRKISVKGGEIELLNSFAEFDSVNDPVFAEKDIFGKVELYGGLDATAVSTGEIVAFTLPVGWRPEFTQFWVTHRNTSQAKDNDYVFITPDGDVTVQVNSTDDEIDITSVIFRAKE